MATSPEFVTFVVDQLAAVPQVAYRKMFGEYALYANGKVVALICSDQLFVKQTQGGRDFLGEPVEAPAYPGAKPSFLIEDGLEDADWLAQLINLTEQELPVPKPKKKKAKKKS